MTFRGRGFDITLLIVGIGYLAFLLSLSKPIQKATYLDAERDAGLMLRAGHYSDLTQDVIGFRALCTGDNAYPLLGPAMQKLKVYWNIQHYSTHPPTAFLLVSPIAWLPIDQGARIWGWMMVGCLAVSFYCLGCNLIQAVALGLISLAWPPVALCLGQLTPIWLLGVCAAFRLRVKWPAAAGAMLGIAAATKLAPAILLVLLLRARNSLIGFAVVWVVLIGALLALSPPAIPRYFQVNALEVRVQFGRRDNSSIIARASHSWHTAGKVIAVAFPLLVLATNLREVYLGSPIGWYVLSYLAVAFLPILWVYSVVPLLFLGRWAMLGGVWPRVFVCTFILVTTVVQIWNSPVTLTWMIVWLGAGLIITGITRVIVKKESFINPLARS